MTSEEREDIKSKIDSLIGRYVDEAQRELINILKEIVDKVYKISKDNETLIVPDGSMAKPKDDISCQYGKLHKSNDISFKVAGPEKFSITDKLTKKK